MKNLYLIGGTMGVGKTTVCQLMKRRLSNCVFLDGDWCWDMHPFTVNDETKSMVQENICFLLNQFIRCSAYDNIVFCWVMHEQKIIDDILSGIDGKMCNIRVLSLVCSEEALRLRLEKDVRNGIRTDDVIKRSIARLPLYDLLATEKIDVTEITAQQAALAVTEGKCNVQCFTEENQ